MALSAADPVLNLPDWSEESRKMVSSDEWVPGGGLLLTEIETYPAESTAMQPPTSAEMTEERRADEIPEEFLDRYFAHRPETFLLDPQGLLDPTAMRDRLAFLNYHSADSQIDFHVYLFGPEQEIPGEVREEEISERFFGEGRHSLTLFYYLGAPQRSEIFLSPGLTDSVSDAERRRILQSSILASLERSDSISQLEAFCVQTSIRIYWIERAAGLVGEGPVASTIERKEVAPGAVPTRADALKKMFDAFWWEWGALFSVSTFGLLISLGSVWLARARAKYRLPEFEVAARLGGAHAAGVGAVIGFGSTTQSPSTQQSKVPEYFGGI
ncbi:hypothetical protein [Haloferula sp.]|uniref:hypothetical protein n=1 Tax=Haloferula sp. TaxID=2497595 RepID=UPI003C794DEF